MKLCPKFFGLKCDFGIISDSIVFHGGLGTPMGSSMGSKVVSAGMASPSQARMTCSGSMLL